MGERLNRVRNGKKEYERLLARVEELKAIAEKITPVLSDMPKGGSKAKDDTWATLADYKTKLERKLEEYIKDSIELEQEIDEAINSQRIRTAMKYRYVNCLKGADIAERMNYDQRTISRLLCTGRNLYEGNFADKEV